jgi:hypothetical protein
MSKLIALAGVVALAASGIAIASANQTVTEPASSDPAKVCKMVATDKPNTKPFELCMTKAEWEAKAIADAKDANRIVCHYEEEPGTRLRSHKICQPASAWNARTAGDREQVEGIQMKTCVPGAGC